MNKILKMMETRPTIVLLFLLLNIPILCSAQIILDESSVKLSDIDTVVDTVADTLAAPPPLVSLRNVVDTTGKPVVANVNYTILPANKIEGLGEDARGVGLFSYNQTCPFHVALWLTALPLTFVPDDSLGNDGYVYETEPLKVVFDYKNMDCPEPKVWEVSSEDDSHAYLKTGGEDDQADDLWFQIKRVDESSNTSVYKIQSCENPDIQGVTCKDVNVVTIQPRVMVLVINQGVPLHVKFQKF